MKKRLIVIMALIFLLFSCFAELAPLTDVPEQDNDEVIIAESVEEEPIEISSIIIGGDDDNLSQTEDDEE